MSGAPSWPAVDLAAWRELPHVSGRLASRDDVAAGRAVFYLDVGADAQTEPATLTLPACAVQRMDDGREEPVIVVQAETLNGRTIVGVRYLAGGGGVCELAEVELLPGPDARFGAPR